MVEVPIKGGRKSSDRIARRRMGKGAEYSPDAVERYNRFQELGTRHHLAQPFLRPSLEGSQAAGSNGVNQKLAAGTEQEARSL